MAAVAKSCVGQRHWDFRFLSPCTACVYYFCLSMFIGVHWTIGVHWNMKVSCCSQRATLGRASLAPPPALPTPHLPLPNSPSLPSPHPSFPEANASLQRLEVYLLETPDEAAASANSGKPAAPRPGPRDDRTAFSGAHIVGLVHLPAPNCFPSPT